MGERESDGEREMQSETDRKRVTVRETGE